MKCYLKSLRYSLYLVVLLAVSGCSNNPWHYFLENQTLNLDFPNLFNKSFNQPSTYHVQMQASPDRVSTNYSSVKTVKQSNHINRLKLLKRNHLTPVLSGLDITS